MDTVDGGVTIDENVESDEPTHLVSSPAIDRVRASYDIVAELVRPCTIIAKRR